MCIHTAAHTHNPLIMHTHQQKPSEVNELLQKEETLVHEREAVIDDAVLLCHIAHRRPRE